MLPFLRSDLARFVAYTPHPGGVSSQTPEAPMQIDHLDTNESPYDLPDELKQKLTWHFQQEIASNRYPNGTYVALKAAIAQYVTESAQLPAELISAEHISVGNGSDELIRSLLIATCLGGEGSILVAEPTFSMYAILANTLGIPVHRVGRSPDDFAMDLQAAEAAIANADSPPIRVVFVVHPNSPTGNALTGAELDWLRSLPSEILVVIDEAYFEFSQTTLAGELGDRPNWVILRTFSKAFRLAAHRVGYAIAHPELIATLEKVRLPYNLPAFSQAAALLALQHRHPLLSAIPTLLEERQTLTQGLKALDYFQVWDSAANFVFVRLNLPNISEEESAQRLESLFQSLRNQGTLVRKISNGLRITVGKPAENQRTLSRLERYEY